MKHTHTQNVIYEVVISEAHGDHQHNVEVAIQFDIKLHSNVCHIESRLHKH